MYWIRLCFVGSIVMAVATIWLSVSMGSVPAPAVPMADGYATPILALEFAQSLDDLAFLQGAAAADLRAALVRMQALDTWFPIAYAGMAALFLLGTALSAREGRWIALAGFAVALAVIPADWMENDVINLILADLSAGADPAERLDALWAHTWMKWGLIALYAALTAGIFIVRRRFMFVIPNIIAVLAIGATWFSDASGSVAEVMGLSMLPFMLAYPIAAAMSLPWRPAAN